MFLPAPFSPPLEPRELGGIYEIRVYTLAPGAIPGMLERWSEKIGERVKLSPLVGAWYSELGALNQWVHIWAYKDAAERQRIRAEAIARGIWPPGSAARGGAGQAGEHAGGAGEFLAPEIALSAAPWSQISLSPPLRGRGPG